MRTSDFDYELPPGLIAQAPAEPRDAARLMVVPRGGGPVEHRVFQELPSLLHAGDLLVVNDTRVMAARLLGRREDTTGRVEALLVQPVTDTRWETLFKPARGAVDGRRFVFDASGGELGARPVGRREDVVELEFERPFDPATVGQVPLPPYIKHYEGDPERYQLCTAGRHGVRRRLPRPALHADSTRTPARDGRGTGCCDPGGGAGHVQAVTVDDPGDHALHAEHHPTREAADSIRRAQAEGRRVVAVGTTVVRTVEHVARALGEVREYSGWTSLKILPGDEFRVVDALITNFHLPRSTLLMLVCAFAGTDRVMEAYREAMRETYRFYSFGDAMVVL
jgi:S-adenosylmethionine:tRNA ribosyltransferase-isomerase